LAAWVELATNIKPRANVAVIVFVKFVNMIKLLKSGVKTEWEKSKLMSLLVA
jgi:ABC-type molybdate transport system substrate-binding protein